MDKMKQETPDLTAQNVEKIAALFPNCVTEMRDDKGKVTRGVNFELLKQMLSPDVVESAERYEFSWVGKKASIAEANKPIRKTLRPCPEESKNWNTTENLYIEGDNLAVLKLLQESYLGKVKMIYIDPPYNTGHDFVYPDSFVMNNDTYDDGTQRFNDDGTVNYKRENSETAAKYHSNWCSMMYSRLLLARNLLAEDGVVFISIDDNEQENLKKICDEVFGADNFVAELPTIMNLKGNGDQFGFAGTHEYTLVYLRSRAVGTLGEFRLDEEIVREEWEQDDKGFYKQGAGLVSTGVNSPRTSRPKLWFPIFVKDGKLRLPPREEVEKFYDSETGIFNDEYLYAYIEREEKAGGGTAILPLVKGREARWRWGYDKLVNDLDEILVIPSGKSYSLYKKQRPAIGNLPSKKPKTLFYKPEYSSGNGTREVEELIGVERAFSHPKPLQLLRDFLEIGTTREDLILDFFSGSATTAHAVMQLNAEDGGHRKFIMVQLPEPCDEKSEAFKAGYKNICEIGKERICRAGEKILQDHPEAKDLDVGFRVLKLDDANMKDVFYAPNDYDQGMLVGLESNIKEDRSDLDLLFGCLLEWGLPLGLPCRSEQIEGCTVHVYDPESGEYPALIACFEEKIPERVVTEIAKRKPLRAVFRDSSFADSPSKINVFEIFKRFMPEDADDISKRIRVI